MLEDYTKGIDEIALFYCYSISRAWVRVRFVPRIENIHISSNINS